MLRILIINDLVSIFGGAEVASRSQEALLRKNWRFLRGWSSKMAKELSHFPHQFSQPTASGKLYNVHRLNMLMKLNGAAEPW